MKIVPFYPNEDDNLHCLQACVRSALDYFEIDYKDEIIDEQTGFFGVMSWLPHSVNFLHKKNLKIELVSPANYELIADQGEEYLKTLKSDLIFDKEKREGQYNHLAEVRQASRSMIDEKLWINKRLEISELASFLEGKQTLAIAKTVYEWLHGNAIAGTSHYVTVIKQYKPGEWLIHDPGLPPKENRKVSQSIEGISNIFGDIILISNK